MTKTTVKFAAIAALVAGLGLVSATTANAATFGTTANSGSTTAKRQLRLLYKLAIPQRVTMGLC